MQLTYNPYIIALVITTALALVITFLAWRNRSAPGWKPFAVLSLALATWSLGYALELGSVDLSTMVFWAKLQYLSIVTVPVAWLAFVLLYTGREKWVTHRFLILISIIPLFTLLMVSTNDYHGLILKNVELHTRGSFPILVRTFGPGFWIHTSYCYLLIFLGAFFLLQALIRSPHLYRGQIGALLVASLAPLAGNVIFLSGKSPFPSLDLTPFAFTLSALAITWGVFRGRLLDIVPIAYDTVIKGMHDSIFILDIQNRVVDLNMAAQRIIGKKTSVASGKPIEEVLYVWPELLRLILEGKEQYGEISLGEGELQQIFDLHIIPLKDDGHPLGSLVVLRDITKRKRAEEALRESDATGRAILDAIPDLIFQISKDGVLLEYKGIVKGSYWKPEDILGKNINDILPPEVARLNMKYLKRTLEDGEIQFFEYPISFRDGLRYFEARMVKSRDDEVLAIVRDISERKMEEEEKKKLEAQLLHAQKMESIGTIASGVAHNFRNILMGVSVNSQVLQMKYRDDHRLQKFADRINGCVKRGAKLVEGLVQFSRKQTGEEFKVLNLVEVIKNTYDLISKSFDKMIDIRIDLAESILVMGDDANLSMVLMNICTNARDAMPEGGVLGIAATQKGDLAEVVVSDTGVGMDKETVKKCFDPFFTTKEVGKGTGLGLSTSYGIVEDHGGYIHVYSELNKGTTFKLIFPLALTGEQVSEEDLSEIVKGKGMKVLVVDDEEEMLKTMEDLLEGIGYRSVCVNNGKEAIERYSSWQPDAVLMDRNMPEMDGITCTKKILEQYPDARVILISGYDDEGPHGIDFQTRDSISGYLTKPVDIPEMTQLLARLFNEKDRSY